MRRRKLRRASMRDPKSMSAVMARAAGAATVLSMAVAMMIAVSNPLHQILGFLTASIPLTPDDFINLKFRLSTFFIYLRSRFERCRTVGEMFGRVYIRLYPLRMKSWMDAQKMW